LRFTTWEALEGIEYWGLVEYPTIPEQPDDLQYRVRQYDRMDTLADAFYGDSTLQWVIAVANDLELWPSDLNENDVLRIPAPRFVLQVLFESFAKF
jgi:hypothetical protein